LDKVPAGSVPQFHREAKRPVESSKDAAVPVSMNEEI
jgi:hypothetical protein